ncbi:hypothetical protein SAMN02745944_02713 [Clostridium magnum DSM 2767]|nr:hypothetical protein SAMN02745944_02713 [Clostridium magnum DSM 2767]
MDSMFYGEHRTLGIRKFKLREDVMLPWIQEKTALAFSAVSIANYILLSIGCLYYPLIVFSFF